MPSIVAKMARFKSMQLSQMQDLGGCRAILTSVEEVHSLVALYEHRPCSSAVFCEKYDHIATPKSDGYRGVHLIYRYYSKHADRAIYNGLKIEIQIRSWRQHAWATALETIDTFTWQKLKSGLGRPEWSHFFLLMSAIIAKTEKSPMPQGMSGNWIGDLYFLIQQLRVKDTLLGIGTGVKMAEELQAAAAYILILDSNQRTTEVLPFDSNESAAEKYEQIEKDTVNDPNIQAVQVSVDSLSGLRKAYPNYYLDTGLFIDLLDGVMEGVEKAMEMHEKGSPPNGIPSEQ